MKDNIDSSDFKPSDTLYTQTVTQKHLDECARALNRPLFDFEVRILDEILSVQERVNKTLTKRGQLTRTHSLDEVVAVFVERVMHKDAQKLTEKIIKENTESTARASIMRQLGDIANDHQRL